MKTFRIGLTTDTAGAATGYSGEATMGIVYAVKLIDGDLADGVDLTLTSEDGDVSITILSKADWNSDQIVYPRVLEALNTDGTALANHCMPIVCGRIKAVLAQGGSVKTGAVVCYVAEL